MYLNFIVDVSETVVDVDIQLGEQVSVLSEHVLEGEYVLNRIWRTRWVLSSLGSGGLLGFGAVSSLQMNLIILVY